MYNQFPKFVTEDGKAFELYGANFSSRKEARERAEGLKRQGRISSYRTRVKKTDSGVRASRKKVALYVY